MKKWIIGGAVAVAVGAIGTATGAIPVGNVIDGCYQKNNASGRRLRRDP